jgi:hypothetical protein
VRRWMRSTRGGQPSRPFFVLLLSAACSSAPRLNPYADPALDCRSFETLISRSGEATPHMSRPLWRVRACPERAARIFAKAVRDTYQSSDTAVLGRTTWLTQYVHDQRILDAAEWVATNPASAELARISALRVMIWQKAPGHGVGFRDLARGETVWLTTRSSYTGHFYHGMIVGDTMPWPVFARPMRPDYVKRIDSVARRLHADTTVPASVRRAAHLTWRFPPDRELKGR